MASVMSVKPLRRRPRTPAVCPISLTEHAIADLRYGPVEEPASGASVVPSASPEAHSPYNGGAIWRKNPKSSKSCSMTH